MFPRFVWTLDLGTELLSKLSLMHDANDNAVLCDYDHGTIHKQWNIKDKNT